MDPFTQMVPWERLLFLGTDVLIVGMFLVYQDRQMKANAKAQHKRDDVIAEVSERCHAVSEAGHKVLRELEVTIRANGRKG